MIGCLPVVPFAFLVVLTTAAFRMFATVYVMVWLAVKKALLASVAKV